MSSFIQNTSPSWPPLARPLRYNCQKPLKPTLLSTRRSTMKRATHSRIRQIIAPTSVIALSYVWAFYMLDHVRTLVS